MNWILAFNRFIPLRSPAETHFYLQDMIYVAECKVGRKFGDYFIRQIVRLHEMTASISS